MEATRVKVEKEELGKFSCKLCSYQGTIFDSLNRHVKRVHAKIREHQCEECGAKFSQRGQMVHHTKSVHWKLKEHIC